MLQPSTSSNGAACLRAIPQTITTCNETKSNQQETSSNVIDVTAKEEYQSNKNFATGDGMQEFATSLATRDAPAASPSKELHSIAAISQTQKSRSKRRKQQD